MTTSAPAPVRYGLVAAAVLAAAILGGAYLVGGGMIGGERDASPSPSSTAPGPRSIMDPTDGTRPAGAYYLDLPALPARIDFDIPAGWWDWSDREKPLDSTVQALLINTDATGAANGSAWGLSFTVVDEVYVDPCVSSATMDPSVSESAEALAEAFSSWPGLAATSEDVTLGGYSGKEVDITRGEGMDCTIRLFTTPSGYQFTANFPSVGTPVNQFILLDVEGSVLVIWTTDYPGTSEYEVGGGASPDPEAHVQDQAALHGILDSIVITPR